MKIIVYTQPGCLACDLVKSVLKESNQEYVEKIIGYDLSREEFKLSFPDAETVPFIIMGEEHVKYSEFVTKFREDIQAAL